jgi:hypothetical protein
MYVLDFLQVAVLLVVFVLYFRLDSKVSKINLDSKSDKLDELNKYLVSMQLDTDKRLLEHSFQFSTIKDKLRDNDLAMKKQALQIKFNNELNKRVEHTKTEHKKDRQPKKETKHETKYENKNEYFKSVWSKVISNPTNQVVETKIKDKKELSHHVTIIMQDKYGLSLPTYRKKNYKDFMKERNTIYQGLYYHCLTKGKSLESYLKQMEKKNPKTTNEKIF